MVQVRAGTLEQTRIAREVQPVWGDHLDLTARAIRPRGGLPNLWQELMAHGFSGGYLLV